MSALCSTQSHPIQLEINFFLNFSPVAHMRARTLIHTHLYLPPQRERGEVFSIKVALDHNEVSNEAPYFTKADCPPTTQCRKHKPKSRFRITIKKKYI